jgi:hypothetical protein
MLQKIRFVFFLFDKKVMDVVSMNKFIIITPLNIPNIVLPKLPFILQTDLFTTNQHIFFIVIGIIAHDDKNSI